MPSADFMRSVLGHGNVVEEELPDAPEQEQPEEADPEVEADEGDEQVEAPEEDEADAAQPDEEAEEDPQDGDEYEEETPSALKRRLEDTRAYATEMARARAEATRERDEAMQTLAYLQGQVEAQRNQSGETFQEWADDFIENDAEAGLAEARAFAEQTGDFGAAYAYVDRWATSDPYRASTARVYLDMEIAMRQRAEAQQQPPETQQARETISQAWRGIATEYPDMTEGSEVLGGAIDVMRGDKFLNDMLNSGDVERAAWALRTARASFIASRPTTRRVARSTQEAVAADKARASVAQGNGAPDRQRGAPPVPQEFEGSMKAFENWGMVRDE